ncbi:hypothetical protein SPRG_20245 [Saprolegnia parasitica CBS 223.65]|uniref:Uncharacterized protein n=1 Tax=Saprolegnia parasitica (strain CBS 223.65) TaxID=695850 RepID=A0A067CMP3_SAPPC|nr:hypothetical protein SPRG_20245 [Saprolegnia parasitica CBS 223.65]KDO28087.1 hypothetical protein SPRG_20245 [Saprolegnia parasitica CBS 223.65]|eukprot:XP_012201231.1 hypothetical protein SPRG_20245 [Saprolegnia parasitica CBS 223.65]
MQRFKGDSLPTYYAATPKKSLVIADIQSHCSPTTPTTYCAAPDVPQYETPPRTKQDDDDDRRVRPTSSNNRNHVVVKRRVVRPSLSAQLASIGQQAQTLVESLRPPTVGGGADLIMVPTSSMKVGRLECKFPSPARFDETACRYQFLVASRDIAMIMYYRDMTQATFDARATSFKFKIGHALDEFGADYDHRNRQHFITIGFASVSDFERVRAYLRLRLPRHRRPTGAG